MNESKPRRFSTLAVHAGQKPDPVTGALNVPIYATSTYAQAGIGEHKGYEYSRVSNPTRDAVEECLCALEGGYSAHVFGSGMAAIAGLVAMLKSGDHILCGAFVYGGTSRYFNQIVANYGIAISYVDTSNIEQVRAAIRPNTRLLHLESPTNPLLQLSDIRAVAEVCHERGVEVCVDNTFMSPYFQRPLELGADIVVHSTTKFLNGHSDGLGGVIIGSKPEHKQRFAFVQKCMGAILSPFECYLILRGVKTLAVRMRQHDSNGQAIAAYLVKQSKVQKIFYPGLPSHPGHELACKQQAGFGSLLSFDIGTSEAAHAFVKKLQLCTVGESLGGVETLISYPATMTYSALGPEGRAKIGITDGLLRLSVGIEDAEDLIEDLDQAFRSSL